MLAEIAEAGLRSRRGLSQQPRLLELACVTRRARTSDVSDLAAALGTMLAEIIDALSDPELRTVARHLFGLVGGRMATKQARLQAAGRNVGHSWETLRKRHVPELLAEMADHLDQIERLQRGWQAMERREQVSSELALDWIRRFDIYSVLAFHANAMANDLESALATPREAILDPIDATPREDLLQSALHRWAAFSRVDQRYTQSYSGIWLISSVENLEAVVAAVEVLDRDVPFDYRDGSWLRLRLLDARDYELDAFIHQLRSEERGQRILDQWTRWADRCRCTKRRSQSCRPHQLITEGHRLYEAMDVEWKRVADWYREPGSDRYLAFPDHLA